jgi:hypothetical protein
MNLTERFTELLHINWGEFVKVENDDNATSDESMICGLIRACADGDMRSIKTAFARSDGEVEIPVQIKTPKFYVRYVSAKEMEQGTLELESGSETLKEESYDIATAKLRETLNQMRKAPKKVVEVVLGMRTRVDDDYRQGNPIAREESIPMVKSVIVANLLHLAGYGNSNAVTEVFNQIDGKLVKTITLLGGEDVYVDDFTAEIAPSHSIKDKDGYYVAEDKTMTSLWLRGFAKTTPQLILDSEDEDFS